MKIMYREYGRKDCQQYHVPKKKLYVKAVSEPCKEGWIKLVGFLDEDKEALVFVPYGSKIECEGKEYEILRGKMFVIEENKEKALEDDDSIYLSDLCLLGKDGKRHYLRKLVGKYIRVKKEA